MPDPNTAAGDAVLADKQHSVDQVIPVVAERAVVGTRVVETGQTVLHKTVSERAHVIDAMLQRSDIAVERVAVGRVVADTPPPRQEGDTWIFPVLEERLVVTTELVLKEELRVRTIATQEAVQHTVNLREEHVEIETKTNPRSDR